MPRIPRIESWVRNSSVNRKVPHGAHWKHSDSIVHRGSRRTFVNRREALGAFAAFAAQAVSGANSSMQYRTLGRTGQKVSCLGMGGAHIGKPTLSADESIRLIRQALDRGLNFLDNSWDYNNGQSEIRMGQALRDGYRQKAFLMTKFDGRTKGSATKQIDESLKRLQTDHVDLLQFHENIRFDDPDRFFAEGGAAE